MSYIKGIFDRASIQQFRSFLLNGTEQLDISDESYEKRLRKDLKTAVNLIHKYFPNGNEELEQSLIDTTATYEDVYMEIGLQVGMLLAAQIFEQRA